MKLKSNTQTTPEPRKERDVQGLLERDVQVPGRERAAGQEEKDGLIARGALTPAQTHPLSANKLTQAQKTHIYQLIAAGYKAATIVRWIKLIYGITVSRQNVHQMRHSQPERVDQGRKEIEKKIGLAAPIASKLHRVAKRQELIESLERRIWRVTSETKSGVKVLAGCHEVINRILDSVKAELEPYEVNVNVDLRAKTAQQYADVTDSGVISEAMDKLKAAGMEVAQVVPPNLADNQPESE